MNSPLNQQGSYLLVKSSTNLEGTLTVSVSHFKTSNTRAYRPKPTTRRLYRYSGNSYVYKDIRIKFRILKLDLLTGSTVRRCFRLSARMSARIGKHRLFSRLIDSNVSTVKFTNFLMFGFSVSNE